MRFIRHLALFTVGSSTVGLAACTSILGDFDVSAVDTTADGGVDATSGTDGAADAPQSDVQTGDDAPSDATQPADSSTHDAAEAGCTGTVCGTTCTDTTSDVHHCGTCAIDCTTLPHVMSATGVTCMNSRCVVPAASCETNYGHCTANGSDGCETDFTRSSTCGSCSNACVSPTGLCNKDSTTMLYHCASSCMAPSPDLCGTTCTDVQTDPTHCSNCNMACPAVTGGGTATCSGGTCGVLCNSGNHECGASTRCAADNDINNCGASCVQCTAPVGGSVACTGGSCAPACPGTQSNCSGTCIDTSTDPNHCGSCGATACAAPKTACAGGACACPAGKTFCSASNTCTDPMSDAANCGSCGHSCQGGTCSAGKCSPLQIVVPGIIGNGLNGLYTLRATGSDLIMSNCLSGQQRAFAVKSDGTAEGTPFGMGMGSDYCGHAMTSSLNTWVAADDGASANNIYYATFLLGSWGAAVKVNAASFASRVLTMESWSGGGNYLAVLNTGSPNVSIFSNPFGSAQSPTTTSITSCGAGATGGMATSSSALELYISCPAVGKIVKTFFNNASSANQTTWMGSGGGTPSILRNGGSKLFWMDRTARKFYSMTYTGGSPGDLTSNVALPDAPDDFVIDGNSIYWWNLTTGRIYVIAADGTASGTVSPIAQATSGYSLGSVATDASAIYWAESNGSQKGNVWKLAK